MKRCPLGITCFVTMHLAATATAPAFAGVPPRTGNATLSVTNSIVYQGHVNTSLGAALLANVGDSLLVASGIGSSGNDGVAVSLDPRAEGLEITWGAQTILGDSIDVGAALITTARGIAGGSPATLVTLRREVFPGKMVMSADFSGVGAASETLEVRRAGVRVYYQVVPNLQDVELIFDPSAAGLAGEALFDNGRRRPMKTLVSEPVPGIDVVIVKKVGFAPHPDSGVVGHDVTFATGDHTLYIDGTIVRGNRVLFTQAGGTRVSALTGVDVRALNPGGSHLSQIQIRNEVSVFPAPGADSVTFGGLSHSRLGVAVLGVEGDSLLRVGGIGSSGNDGVSVRLHPGAVGLEVAWSTPAQFDAVDAGASVTLTARGVVNSVPNTPLLVLRRQLLSDRMEIRADFSGVGAASETLEVRRAGVRVYYQAVPNSQLLEIPFTATPMIFSKNSGRPPTTVLGKGDPLGGIDVSLMSNKKAKFQAPTDTTVVKHHTTFLGGVQEIVIGGVHVFGDEILFSQGPSAVVQATLTGVDFQALNPGGTRLTSFTIHGEEEIFPREPSIASVDDVPGDQGGKVLVLWNASGLDGPPLFRIGSYTLWRRVTNAFAAAAIDRGAPVIAENSPEALPAPGSIRVIGEGIQAEYWEFIASIPARGVSGYGYTATTTSDSTTGPIPWNVFFVDAQEAASPTFYVSAPDSGYSVDNLPPGQPAAFTGEYLPDTQSAILHWAPNAEDDFSVYRLYRGATVDFIPGPGSLIATQADTGHTDVGVPRSHYKLIAVDVHGNASAAAVLLPAVTTDVPVIPVIGSVSLGPAAPNPARTEASFTLRLPRAADVRVAIFDASGRQSRLLTQGPMPEGEHRLSWDLRDDHTRLVGSGLYFVRAEVAKQVFRRRLVAIP